MIDISNIKEYSLRYRSWFVRGVHDNTTKSGAYLKGLFSYGKSNMERMAEQVLVNEQQLHHFMSVSDWDAKGVMGEVAGQMQATFQKSKQPKGLLLDESSWQKKDKHSVGVAKQYLGSVGKIANGQVVVFSAIAQADQVGLVDAELYLPKEWTQDAQRMQQAGVPKERCEYQTKAELALQMIEGLEGKVNYELIGADSIYGNCKVLRQNLHKKGKRFVLDTTLKQPIYLQDPAPYIAQSKPGSYRASGRKKSSYSSDGQPITVEQLVESLATGSWKKVAYRKGTKGWLVRMATVVELYLWSGKLQMMSR